MKYCFYFLIIVYSFSGFGQQKLDKLNFIQLPEESPFQYLYIPTSFDEDTLPKSISLPESGEVIEINLYYSNNKTNPGFNQQALNARRLKALIHQIPQLDSMTYEYNILEQVACFDAKSCEDLFHGFELIYVLKPKEEEWQKEERMVQDVINEITEVLADTSNNQEDEDPVYFKSVWDDNRGWVPDTSSAFRVKRNAHLLSTTESNVDSMFKTVMQRNSWKNTAIVVDVTYSMSKYYLGILDYLMEEDKEDRLYSFFNDGDGKNTMKKVVGKTGGIYNYYGSNPLKVAKTMQKAMHEGGDAQENDLEAAAKALLSRESLSAIVLVADASSPVRDMILLPNITVPIHIILCGEQDGYFNCQYLKIARLTNGSVHTVDGDYEINENINEIKIGEAIYFWDAENEIYRLNR